jgi:cytochrome c oxidase subunit II
MVRAVLLVGLGALVLAASALAGNGGLLPVKPASENAEGIRQAYWLILAVTGVVFILVEATLVLFLVRYRRGTRARDAEGPQVRGHTNIEIAWTLVPVLLLAAIVAFVFTKLPVIEDAPAAKAGNGLTIGVEGHQYYWLFRYPGGQVSVDHMVVPVGAVVTLDVTAPDVIHSWWIPALGGKIDAIPGRTNHTWFKAQRAGTFTGRCAELCGTEHALMLASVDAVSPREFSRFLKTHTQASQAVGKETFEGVCAKCHGFSGEGTDEAPNIAGRTFDALTAQLIREGGTRMPAVGASWSDAQVQATVDYLNATIGAGAQSGG